MLSKLGRYEIQDCIGRGAMADVYRAFDPSINRMLAIKVLKPELEQVAEYSSRFLREAKAAGALSHPNIVTIYDVGEEDGHPYIVMEMLAGEPLDGLIQSGLRLGAQEVAQIALQLAEALSYAHAAGVVHRDIKPSNILVAPDGRSIKLLDFGIAWLSRSEGIGGEDTASRTQIGQVLGTPRYMSPEQALGQPTDGRSDLFSVGVVLYELVTGRRAFDASNPATLALQITHSAPQPIAALAPDCPGGLQYIINKLLNKRPERRYADGAQLADALRRELAREGPSAARRNLPLTARMTLTMGAITAVVLLGCTGAVIQREDQAMARMALSSGAAITSFIASNAALTAVDNAALPPQQRDWLPVEAFVKTTVADPNVRQITVVDDGGVVRASTDPSQIGRPYRGPPDGRLLRLSGGVTVADARAADGTEAFRFIRPITYAGRVFGRVDVSVNKADLISASNLSRWLLGFLALVTLGAVLGVSYAAARAVATPLRRLKAALADAARGNLDFRISHARSDEFGELFDGFNQLADALQTRLDTAANPGPASAAPPMLHGQANQLSEAAAPTPPSPRTPRAPTSASTSDMTQIAAFGLPLPVASIAKVDDRTQLAATETSGAPKAGQDMSPKQLSALALINRLRDVAKATEARS